MIGSFIELSVPTRRILDSIGFYEDLGLRQLETGDILDYPYAVLSDGNICVGLHDIGMPPDPLMTFVRPNLAENLNELRSRGMRIERMQTGDDEFNELVFSEPDGHQVRLIEARTFSPPHFEPELTTLCGAFREITLPVRDLDIAIATWDRLGFEPLEHNTEPHPHAWLRGEGLVLGLHRTRDIDRLALSFQTPQLNDTLGALADKGIYPENDGPPGVAMLMSPDGLPILLHGG